MTDWVKLSRRRARSILPAWMRTETRPQTYSESVDYLATAPPEDFVKAVFDSSDGEWQRTQESAALAFEQQMKASHRIPEVPIDQPVEQPVEDAPPPTRSGPSKADLEHAQRVADIYVKQMQRDGRL